MPHSSKTAPRATAVLLSAFLATGCARSPPLVAVALTIAIPAASATALETPTCDDFIHRLKQAESVLGIPMSRPDHDFSDMRENIMGDMFSSAGFGRLPCRESASGVLYNAGDVAGEGLNGFAFDVKLTSLALCVRR